MPLARTRIRIPAGRRVHPCSPGCWPYVSDAGPGSGTTIDVSASLVRKYRTMSPPRRPRPHLVLTAPSTAPRAATAVASRDFVAATLAEINTHDHWTSDSLEEDDKLERFFAALPSLRSSKVDPLPDLIAEKKLKLIDALIGLLERTFSSDLLHRSIKHRHTRRPSILPTFPEWVLRRILAADQYRDCKPSNSGILSVAWEMTRTKGLFFSYKP
ncbi:hypothetical protein EDB87DRAFT_1833247 [Lactarius vividus]|nr:hypothetical protein EDB87DRAFT_1833247 [Lactarius vividus]